MKLKLFVLTLMAGWLTLSCNFDVCSSKRMYVNAYDQFMKKVEKNQDRYSAKEWEELDDQFERFSGECFDKYKDELSRKEYKQIVRHNVRYVVIRVKNELPFDISRENEEKVDRFIDELDLDEIRIKGEEIKKVWEDFDKDKFKDAAEEFGKGFEKLGKAFEDLGEELKDLFEESTQEKK